MECHEFHKILPDIIDDPTELQANEKLHSCATCLQLVADLKFISERARLLLPLLEPSTRVWEAIAKSLPRAGSKAADVP